LSLMKEEKSEDTSEPSVEKKSSPSLLDRIRERRKKKEEIINKTKEELPPLVVYDKNGKPHLGIIVRRFGVTNNNSERPLLKIKRED
jgi:hypothetical protein